MPILEIVSATLQSGRYNLLILVLEIVSVTLGSVLYDPLIPVLDVVSVKSGRRGCTWVLEIMDSSHFTFYPFFGLTIHFYKGKMI